MVVQFFSFSLLIFSLNSVNLVCTVSAAPFNASEAFLPAASTSANSFWETEKHNTKTDRRINDLVSTQSHIMPHFGVQTYIQIVFGEGFICFLLSSFDSFAQRLHNSSQEIVHLLFRCRCCWCITWNTSGQRNLRLSWKNKIVNLHGKAYAQCVEMEKKEDEEEATMRRLTGCKRVNFTDKLCWRLLCENYDAAEHEWREKKCGIDRNGECCHVIEVQMCLSASHVVR